MIKIIISCSPICDAFGAIQYLCFSGGGVVDIESTLFIFNFRRPTLAQWTVSASPSSTREGVLDGQLRKR